MPLSAVVCYMWMVLDAYNGVSAGGSDAFEEMARRARRSGRRACTRTWATLRMARTFARGRGADAARDGRRRHLRRLRGPHGDQGLRRRRLELWSYRLTLHIRTVPVDAVRFVIMSGAKAEKTGGAMADYNDASLLASWAAARARPIRGGGRGARRAAAPRARSSPLSFPARRSTTRWRQPRRGVRCERCLKPELSAAELRDAISRKIRVLASARSSRRTSPPCLAATARW